MLENLRKLAVPAALTLAGCAKDISDAQETTSKAALGCTVICGHGIPGVTEHALVTQCHPDIPEDQEEQAMQDAYAAWKQLPEEERKPCKGLTPRALGIGKY